MINLLIVDDHKVLRESLCQMLGGNRQFRVIDNVGTISEAKYSLKNQQSIEVIVLDIDLPDGDGVEFAASLRKQSDHRGIVFLSMHCDPFDIDRASQILRTAYVAKNDSLAELTLAITAMSENNGIGYLSSTAQKSKMEFAHDHRDGLSGREKEVLKLLALGNNQRQVANQLCISVRTVEAHVTRIRNKQGLGNLADFTRYAIKTGLISAT